MCRGQGVDPVETRRSRSGWSTLSLCHSARGAPGWQSTNCTTVTVCALSGGCLPFGKDGNDPEPNAAFSPKEMRHPLFREIDSDSLLRYTERAAQVAAMSSVAGAIVSTKDCCPVCPVPVTDFHSTADPIASLSYTCATGTRNGCAVWPMVPRSTTA